MGVIAHEVLHVVNRHHLRRGERDAELWNVAADLLINRLLEDDKYVLPPDGLFDRDRRYAGLSTETIYARLLERRQQQAEQAKDRQPSNQASGGGASGNGHDPAASGQIGNRGKPDQRETHTGNGAVQARHWLASTDVMENRRGTECAGAGSARGWSSGLSAKVELRRFSPDREGGDDRGDLALSELLEKADDGDFLRAVAEAVLQLLMEADVEGLIGAGRCERSGERTTWRNGHRGRSGHQAGLAAAAESEAAAGQLLPAVPGGPKGVGEGVDRGDPGGVDRQGFDAAG